MEGRDNIYVSDTQLEEIRQQVYDWSFGHGLVSTRISPTGHTYVMHIPVSVFPSVWRRALFEQAVELASDFNILVHQLSTNNHFILDSLQSVPDEFTQQLLRIYKQVSEEGVKQPISLGLHRSDYMLHSGNDGKQYLQQVELNTISAAFPSLSTFTSQLHKYIVTRFNLTEKYPLSGLPINESQTRIPKAIATAHKLFADEKAIVVMITQKGERNVWDQRWIEFHLWDSPSTSLQFQKFNTTPNLPYLTSNMYGIPLRRLSLDEIHHRGSLDDDFNLIIDGQSVSVIYFRAGYTPNDYPSPLEWEARLLIERSRAIKCPSISYQLIGAKKVQQIISAEGVLEKLVADQESAKRMRACFTGLYSLAGPNSQQIVDKAIQDYTNYVLKPQREGGGNNIYNEDLRDALKTMSASERAAYILMDRIRPLPARAHIMREGQIISLNAVSELGIYGCFIANHDKIIMNEPGGLLLRTKASSQEDGGVAAGVAVLDSPVLIS